MGTVTVTTISSTGDEKAFLTEIYNYVMALFSGITCDVDFDGTVTENADVDDFVWENNKACSMDFNLGSGFVLRFQSHPIYALTALRSSGYNVHFLYNGNALMQKGTGSTKSSSSGCLSFGNQDSNGDVVTTAYTTNPRKFIFTKYEDTASGIFILWGTSYFGDSFRSTDGFSIMKLKGKNGENDSWYWGAYAGPNTIENASYRDNNGNVVNKSSLFSYEGQTGYLDFISHSTFISGGTKMFASNDIYDCTTVNFGDTLSLKDGANFLAIGAHSMVHIT